MAKRKHEALAALPTAERSEGSRPPLPKVAPWLVIPYGEAKENQAFYNLCESDQKTCRKSIPELSGKSFYQKPCHKGWLIIICDDIHEVSYTPNWRFGHCFLWNPATLETIQLPSIPSSGYTYDKYNLVDCVLTSPPNNLGCGNIDPTIFFLFQRRANAYDYVFLFCCPGDKRWRTQNFCRHQPASGNNTISSLHYLKGSLYAFGRFRVFGFKIEIERKSGDNVSLRISPFSLRFHTTNYSCIGGIWRCGKGRYVVTCDDELYFVNLHYTTPGYMKEVIAVDIERLDFSCMLWKDVDDLGDNVLFYGENTLACCSAAELGFTRGCLYYTLPGDQSLYKYEVEGTGTIILPCIKLPTPWFCIDWIMMPTTFLVGDGQKRTKFMLDKCEEKFTSNGEVKQESPWSILDTDIVNMIAGYLHPIDYLLFRCVCKENRLNLPIVKQASTSDRVINNTDVSPWLVFSITNDRTVYNFVDPMHNDENCFMERPSLRRATIRFQKGGWLLMSEGARSLFFYNPFTKETINLPDLPYALFKLSNISFSSLPTCFDCVVFGIMEIDDDNDVGGTGVYIIARGEKSWKYHEFNNTDTDDDHMLLLNTPALHKGVLYCADYNGRLRALIV